MLVLFIQFIAVTNNGWRTDPNVKFAKIFDNHGIYIFWIVRMFKTAKYFY